MVTHPIGRASNFPKKVLAPVYTRKLNRESLGIQTWTPVGVLNPDNARVVGDSLGYLVELCTHGRSYALRIQLLFERLDFTRKVGYTLAESARLVCSLHRLQKSP